MDGLCDVPGCTNPTLMGWRPLTERRGRQICEYHWNRHKDEQESFDLFEAFKFRRPARSPRRLVVGNLAPTDIGGIKRRCACGRALEVGHRFCKACIEQRERRRKRETYHKQKELHQNSVKLENTHRCKACGEPREPGHTYCAECAKHRKTMARRRAQSRYWRKRHKVAV